MKAAQKMEEMKELTIKYEREKAERLEELDQIKNDFVNNVSYIFLFLTISC